jgi:hypothetical protein
MKNLPSVLSIVPVLLALISVDNVAIAENNAVAMLEQARARSREIEQLKAVLNGPDQNMRLAVFDAMLHSDDEAMRLIAIDTGLASADPLLQGMAFKEAILRLNRILMSLEVDTSQPQAIQDNAQAWIGAQGGIFQLPIIETDRDTGIFKIYSKDTGQVTGTQMTFTYGHSTGQLSLLDETTIKGPVKLYMSGKFGGFIATAKIR